MSPKKSLFYFNSISLNIKFRIFNLLTIFTISLIFSNFCLSQSDSASQEISVPGKISVNINPEIINLSKLPDNIKEVDLLIEKFKNSNLDEHKKKLIIDNLENSKLNFKASIEWKERINNFNNILNNPQNTIENLEKEFKNLKVNTTSISELNLSEMEQNLQSAKSNYQVLSDRLKDLEKNISKFNERRIILPTLLTDAKKKEASLLSQSQNLSNSETHESAASKIFNNSKLILTKNEIECLDLEIKTQTKKNELLNSQKDFLNTKIDDFKKNISILEEALAEKRKLEAENEIIKAQDALAKSAQSYPVIQKIAFQNATFANERQDIAQKLDNISQKISNTQKNFLALSNDYEDIQNKINLIGLTDAIGALLRIKRNSIPDQKIFKKNIQKRQKLIIDLRIKLLNLEEQRQSINNIDKNLEDLSKQIPEEISGWKFNFIKNNLKKSLEEQKRIFDIIYKETNTLFLKLIEMDTLERQFSEKAELWADFIDQRILWIKSKKPLWHNKNILLLKKVLKSSLEFQWFAWFKNQIPTIKLNITTLILAVITIIIFLFFSRKNKLLININTETPDIIIFLKLIFVTLACSLFWPLVFFLTYLSFEISNQNTFITYINDSLYYIIPILMLMLLLKNFFLKNGIAETLLSWKQVSINNLIKNYLKKLILLSIPILFFINLTGEMSKYIYADILETILTTLLFFSILFFSHLFFNKKSLFISEFKKYYPKSILIKLRGTIYFFTVISPAILIITSINGFSFTSKIIAQKIFFSIVTFILINLLCSIAERIIILTRKNMTIKELQESKSSEENAVLLGQLSEMGQKTRKFIRYSSYLITLLIIISFWRDLLPAFTFLDIELWTTNKKVLEIVKLPDGTSQEHLTDKIVSISFVNLLGSICLLWITIIIARHIPWILEMFALRRFGFDTGGIFAVKTITSYLITLLGISFSLHLIGIGWAKVQWLIAAMSVGLGFGLQEIFANFISGLIILFEQPMRVGDIISIGNNTGTVTQIKIRATTITNWDNREVIIPNKEFITGELINWTLTNNTLRHIFKIGVSYGSDIKKVQEILLDVAANCKKILHDPPSKALLSDFGDSSLNFELRVYIDGMDGWADFIHSVNYEIEKKLTEANITIPFPQRDVHIINH